jgi:hypothetical protein
MVNSSLLSEHKGAHWKCEDHENDLKKTNANNAACIAALEATVKSIEARSSEVATAGNKRLSDFEAELSRDLMELWELYVHNFCSIGGLCLPLPEGNP